MTDKEILDGLEERLESDVKFYTHITSGDSSPRFKAKRTYAKEILDIIKTCRGRESDNPLPCPFCGEMPTVTESPDYEVRCENDDCPIAPSTYRYGTREQAIDDWNRRG